MAIQKFLNTQALTGNEIAGYGKAVNLAVPSGTVVASFTTIGSVTGITVRQNDFGADLFVKQASAGAGVFGNDFEIRLPKAGFRRFEIKAVGDRPTTASTPIVIASGNDVMSSDYWYGFVNTADGATNRSLNLSVEVLAFV